MIPIPPEHRPLLAALREPESATILFMVSLPLQAADSALAAFDSLLRQLERHGRRPWRDGSEEAGCSAPETALLRLVGAHQAIQSGASKGGEARFLAASLAQWLVRPEGQQEVAWQGAALARALAAAEPHRMAQRAITAA